MSRRTALAALASIVVVLALAACGGSGGGKSSLTGVLWQWNGLLENNPKSLSAVPDSQNYLLTFNTDGSFDAKADCNNLGGTYKVSGSDLTLQPGPMAKAQCPEGSLSDQYVSLLGKVGTYEIKDGLLTLGLENDSGSMYFHAG